MTIEGEDFELAYDPVVHHPYFLADVVEVFDSDFSALLGRQAPVKKWDRDAPLTAQSSVAELQGRKGLAGLVGRTIFGAASALRWAGKNSAANMLTMVADLPFRSISRMTQNAISENTVDPILKVFNGDLRGALRNLRPGNEDTD